MQNADNKNQEKIMKIEEKEAIAVAKLYTNLGFVDSDESDFANIQTNQKSRKPASLYGELTARGVTQLILKFKSRFLDPNGVFVDLGSGHGRICNHIALTHGRDMKAIKGVELCKKRHALALEQSEKIEYPGTKPEFINEDMLKTDLSDATIAYFDNTAYKPEFLYDIFSLLPPDCVIVYKSGFIMTGDPTFSIETTYNNNLPEDTEPLGIYTIRKAAWRYARGHDF
jgi:hypothetical protein